MSQATGSNPEVLSRSYVFDPRPNLPFRITAKRYWTDFDLEEHASTGQPSKLDNNEAQGDALTLIFTHGTGFHKEQWEPVIHYLFEQQRIPARYAPRIRDMWALDAPNHGDAAVINEEVLAFGYRLFSWEDYARSVHAFLTGLGSGIDVDFSKRNVVAIGHSMGAVCDNTIHDLCPTNRVLLDAHHRTSHPGPLRIRFRFTPHSARRKQERFLAEHRASIRDLENQAYVAELGRSYPEDICAMYVQEHGLRSLPTAEYPDREIGVTLKCTRKQEAACYRDDCSSTIAYRLLPYILRSIPTHITYGEKADFLLDEWRDDVLHNASGGKDKFAGVTWIAGAGHLAVQTKPDAVAEVIWKSLLQTLSSGRLCDGTTMARL